MYELGNAASSSLSDVNDGIAKLGTARLGTATLGTARLGGALGAAELPGAAELGESDAPGAGLVGTGLATTLIGAVDSVSFAACVGPVEFSPPAGAATGVAAVPAQPAIPSAAEARRTTTSR
jgi:hypothetical protein